MKSTRLLLITVNVWRYVKTSSGFADYSEHLTSMALIVALSPAFYFHASFTDYSESSATAR